MSSEDRISKIKARLKAATPGPFSVERRDDPNGDIAYIVHGEMDFAWCKDGLDRNAKQNAQLIAHAPSDLAYLLKLAGTRNKLAEELRAKVKALRREGRQVCEQNWRLLAELSAYLELEYAAKQHTKCPCGPHMLALAAALAKVQEARKP